MSSWSTLRAMDAGTQTFPVLTRWIDRPRPTSKLRAVSAGDLLFYPGNTTSAVFVLLSGKMEILKPGISGERQILSDSPGDFRSCNLSQFQSI